MEDKNNDEMTAVKATAAMKSIIGEKEKKLINKLKDISARGNNAEVKLNHDGSWTIYEVKKKKEKVG